MSSVVVLLSFVVGLALFVELASRVIAAGDRLREAPSSREDELIAYQRASYMRDEISAEELDERVGRVLGLEEEPAADQPLGSYANPREAHVEVLTDQERQAVSARPDAYSRGFYLDGSYVHPREDQER